MDDLVIFDCLEVGGLAVGLDPFDERGPVAERAMHDVPIAAFADPKEAAPMQCAAARLSFVPLEVSGGDVLDGSGGGFLPRRSGPPALGGAVRVGGDRPYGK